MFYPLFTEVLCEEGEQEEAGRSRSPPHHLINLPIPLFDGSSFYMYLPAPTLIKKKLTSSMPRN